ncbi:MAG TPA: UPF0058 family protein [Candidatus Thermoplasmatota archaeon]|nr:UPF0058 family protein [Candidatus Thermoplasmatota archaeon]
MHKDELIQMHTLLCQIKNYVETQSVGQGELFPEYNKMKVSPIHVHRSKGEHKKAIFVLGKELAEVLSSGELSGPGRLHNRLGSMLQRMEKGPQMVKAL